jgi:branched-chain amino acid transport system substrate-binding protein
MTTTWRIRVFLAAAVVAVAAVAAACRASGEAPEIRIGLLATFTGPFADVSGTPTREGAELAVRDADTIRLQGVVHRVVLVPKDFEDRADAAASGAQALINQQRVIAVVGPQFSRHAIAASVVAENSRIPMISPMSSNPATTAGRHYVFRLAFLDDLQGRILARFARETLHARRAAVLYDISTAYSRDIAERFRADFAAAGGTVGAFETFTADQATEFGPQLRRIAASRPDVLFLPNFPDAVNRQVAQLQRAGIRATLLGGDGWDPQTLPPLGAGVDAYVTNQWRPDIPRDAARRFVRHYRDTFHAEPRATAALTYDAVGIVLDAVRRSGSLDPDSLRAAIAATADHDGASGIISFGGRADPRRAVAVSRIVGHELHTVSLVEP